MERLQQASHKLAEAMYQQAPPPADGQEGAPSGQTQKKDDDAVDADYEVVN